MQLTFNAVKVRKKGEFFPRFTLKASLWAERRVFTGRMIIFYILLCLAVMQPTFNAVKGSKKGL